MLAPKKWTPKLDKTYTIKKDEIAQKAQQKKEESSRKFEHKKRPKVWILWKSVTIKKERPPAWIAGGCSLYSVR